MFSDIREFAQLASYDGAQEYENKFKKNFGYDINKSIRANRVERYNPKNDFTIQKPGSYADQFGEHFFVGRGINIDFYHPSPPYSSNDTIYTNIS